MAKTPEPSPINLGLIKGVIKSFIGDFALNIDRQARLVKFKAKGREYIYTYEQLVDELEKMFSE